MATLSGNLPFVPDYEPSPTYLNISHTLRSWLLTRDHKRIGLLFLVTITLFFFVGGGAATLIRINLLTPGGLLVDESTYNRLFTIHGVIMVWFFLIPVDPGHAWQFPASALMIGGQDLAFPRLNLLSYYLFLFSGIFAATMISLGGADTGWTFYTPYSAAFSNTHVTLAVCAVFINGFSSILTGLNFIITVHKMPLLAGMTWFRMPLFCWSLYATSIVMVLATPILAITLLLVGIEHVFGVGIFDPALGGDPILFQHLFWFYSHPAVYIMITAGHGRCQRTGHLLLA